MVERVAYSLAEAGEALGVSPATLRRYMGRGLVRTVRIGRRVVISKKEVERICQEGVRRRVKARRRRRAR